MFLDLRIASADRTSPLYQKLLMAAKENSESGPAVNSKLLRRQTAATSLVADAFGHDFSTRHLLRSLGAESVEDTTK